MIPIDGDVEKAEGGGRLLARGGRIPVPYHRITARGKERRKIKEHARIPSEFHDLWAATIQQAVDDIRALRKAEKDGPPRYRSHESLATFKKRKTLYAWTIYDGNEALQWVRGEKMDGLGFVDLCLALDLDPDVVRKEVA